MIGRNKPRSTVLYQIADYFNISISELLDEESSAQNSSEMDDFGFMVSRSSKNGRGHETIKLTFRGAQPVLSINGTECEISLTYSGLQPEDKLSVCRAMMDRAINELRGG